MSTTSEWLGQGDSAGAYIASSLRYAGTQKSVDWLGQLDTAGAYIASSVLYSGTLKSVDWLGQLDTSGDWTPTSNTAYLGAQIPAYSHWLGQDDTAKEWMDSNGIYLAYTGTTPYVPPTPSSSLPGQPVAILAGGYFGMTWMKNVLVLPKEWWPPSLATPYVGQLYPTTPGASSGQTYPY